MIYTSGTTGPPKGVMLSQYSIVYTNMHDLIETIEVPDIAGWKVVSYLPDGAHRRTHGDHYNTLMEGTEVYCCPNFNDLSSYPCATCGRSCCSACRVYEKIRAGVNAALAAGRTSSASSTTAALTTEIKRAQIAGIDTQDQRDTWDFLDAVAFSTVRQLIGLDQLRMATSGAAPIRAILEWFHGDRRAALRDLRHVRVVGPMTCSPQRNKPGYVGQAIRAAGVKIAEDGEVVCRGGNVFVGVAQTSPRRPPRRSSTDGCTPATSG